MLVDITTLYAYAIMNDDSDKMHMEPVETLRTNRKQFYDSIVNKVFIVIETETCWYGHLCSRIEPKGISWQVNKLKEKSKREV